MPEESKKQLTDNTTYDFDPAYSPSGKRIAYEGYDGNNDSEIYTIKPGGGGRFNVTDNSTDDYYPDYAPGGKRIAYTNYDGNDEEIYTIKPGGGGRHPVTDNSSDDYYPSYSPSGKKLAYVNMPERTVRSGRSNPTGVIGTKSPTTLITTAILTGAVNSDCSPSG